MFSESLFIEANPVAPANFDINQIAVEPRVLGEGAWGCVLKSADGRFAIKVQESQGDGRCVYESGLQAQIAQNVPKAVVSNVYFYSGDVRVVPQAWQGALLMGGCKKASEWAQRGWNGRFCITVMDFVPGKAPNQVSPANFPLFVFSLLYTVTEANEKLGFQHLDIKTPNIILTPSHSTSEKFSVCRLNSEFKFDGVDKIPRLLDFGISVGKDYPKTLNPLETIGGTLMTTPVEVIVGRMRTNNPNLRNYMYTPDQRSYHWSFDLYSIGITALASTVMPEPPPFPFPLLLLRSAPAYLDSFMNTYSVQADKLTMMYVYDMCVLQTLLGNGSYPMNLEKYYPPGTLGYQLLCTPEARTIIDFVVKTDQDKLKPYVDYFRRVHGEEALRLIASLIQWDPEKRGGGKGQVLLHPFFAKYRKNRVCKKKDDNKNKILRGVNPNDKAVVVDRVSNANRQERLKKYVKTLYHQTSPEAAKAIIASQEFRLGKTGYAGGGIYFTDDASTTNYKAHFKGVIIKADVLLGNPKTIYGQDGSITFEKLLREGYDSVFLIRPTGAEYVVYNSDQVRNVRNLDESDLLELELSTVYNANEAAGVMFFIVGTRNKKRVVLLGRELGGAYKGQFNMFGGRHDKSRTRAATAQAEWCEEFGASSVSAGTECRPPEVWHLKSAKKIFANNRIEAGGPSKTTIVIFWDVGENVTSRKKWNENNRKARADPNVPKSYKEMDRLEIFYLSTLLKAAQSTPQGLPAQVQPVDSNKKVPVSMFTLETVRNMKQKKYI